MAWAVELTEMEVSMFQKLGKDWESLERGAYTVQRALDLADSFSEECRAGKEIPAWALALRALACRVRMQKKAAEQQQDGPA